LPPPAPIRAGAISAGKSTLKNIVCGLVAPDVGSIVIQGKSYSRLTPENARPINSIGDCEA